MAGIPRIKSGVQPALLAVMADLGGPATQESLTEVISAADKVSCDRGVSAADGRC